MRNILSIITRELRSYFGSPWSYIITSAFLVVAGYGFGWSSVTYLETSIQGFLGWASFFLLFLGPALTMRLLAEEEKMGTLELLMTSPVRDFEVVLGKFPGGHFSINRPLRLIANLKPDRCLCGGERYSPLALVYR
jgi:ABC-2 type transport system permease protein